MLNGNILPVYVRVQALTIVNLIGIDMSVWTWELKRALLGFALLKSADEIQAVFIVVDLRDSIGRNFEALLVLVDLGFGPSTEDEFL